MTAHRRIAAALVLASLTCGVLSAALAAEVVFTPPAPNPFTTTTTVSLSVQSAWRFRLTIVTASGRPVRHLLNDFQGDGRYSWIWDGRDDWGHNVPSGVYFIQLTRAAAGFLKAEREIVATAKVTIVR